MPTPEYYTVQFSRAAYPVATLAFAGLALVLPVVRLRRRTGVWAFAALRNRDPVERLLSLGLLLSFLLLAAWAAGYAVLGPEALGVPSLHPAFAWLGWLLAAAGLAVVLAAQVQMGASWRIGIESGRTDLVTHGLYQHVRNPIYTGMLLLLLGLVLVSPSPWLALVAAGASAVLGLQARREERHLIAVHGDRFLEWASRAGRFFPGLGRLRPPAGPPQA